MLANMTGFFPFEQEGVRGFLHQPSSGVAERGLVVTHGAGGNCRSPLLTAIANAFSAADVTVLRCDLPFRQRRAAGPPSPSSAAEDRAGLRHAVSVLRGIVAGPVYLGGHSYGGRQASMLAAEEPGLAKALLLLSYPLHPPRKPAQLRAAHFPDLRTRAVFVQGTADPFGSIAELSLAIQAIPAPTQLISVEAGHDLRRGRFDLGPVVTALLDSA
jgi:uncharacterized protein